MLEISVDEKEFYDEKSSMFIIIPAQILKFEHSLSSVYAWESKWHKPFLKTLEKTTEETIDYLNCMVIEGDLRGLPVYYFLTADDTKKINDYILDPMTATWFNDDKRPGRKEVITAEIIYYWMTTMNIPFECDKWHLNRLLTLIRVCADKNAPSKKMSKRDILKRNSALNASRKAKHNTRG